MDDVAQVRTVCSIFIALHCIKTVVIIAQSEMKSKRGDTIIIAGSSMKHLVDNLNHCSEESKPLPASVVKAFDKGWKITRPVCASYFR
jgi:hypothetical protein